MSRYLKVKKGNAVQSYPFGNQFTNTYYLLTSLCNDRIHPKSVFAIDLQVDAFRERITAEVSILFKGNITAQ